MKGGGAKRRPPSSIISSFMMMKDGVRKDKATDEGGDAKRRPFIYHLSIIDEDEG